MELAYYLNILLKRKWLIILTGLLAGLLAYFLITLKDPVYLSESILSTGVIDYTGINAEENNPYIQQIQIDMSFNNLKVFGTSRRCLHLLSFHLLVHDLEAMQNGGTPFRTEVDLSRFSQEELDALRELLKEKLTTLRPEFDNSRNEHLFNTVAKAFKYDFETLKEDHLSLDRMGETDYVKFSFISDSPEFSAFAARQFTNSFIEYFNSLRNSENRETILYLQETAQEKKQVLQNKEDALKEYKEKGELVDLSSQREATVNQIKDLEQERNEAINSINANEKTIRELDRLLRQQEAILNGGTSTTTDNDNIEKQKSLLNKKILQLREQEKKLQNQLIDGTGNRRRAEQDLKEVKKLLKDAAIRLGRLEKRKEKEQPDDDKPDKTRSNDLYEKRVTASIKLTDAKEKLAIVNKDLAELRDRARSYVSDEAYVLNLEREIEIAKEEYEDIVKELNKERLQIKKAETPFTIIEHAQIPEEPLPDRKLLFTAFSAIIGGVLAIMLVLLFSFLDNSYHSPDRFRALTGLPMLGAIPKTGEHNLDLIAIFNQDTGDKNLEQFKEQIRALRFELEKQAYHKLFLFVSPSEQEGKTFLITTLTHALQLKQQKVLIIDTNLKNNTLSRWTEKHTHISPSLLGLLNKAGMGQHFSFSTLKSPYNNLPVTMIKNKGNIQSLLEGVSGEAFSDLLSLAASMYDFVFLEGAALNKFADTRELVDLSDRVIGVFNAGTEMSAADRQTVEYLESIGDKFLGAVLNEVTPDNLKV